MIRRFLRRTVRNAFNLVGYDLRRKNMKGIFAVRQEFDEALVQIRNLGYYPDLVIDVGAANGTPPLQKVFPNSNFFWIEPLQEFEPALKDLQKKLKGEYIIAGIGKTEDRMVMHVHKDLVGSSLLSEADGEMADSVSREIPITTLNKLSRECHWGNFKKILLKADVQGFELKVLQGATEILANVDVIILEVSFYRFLKDAPDFYDVISYMKGIGYVAYDIVGGINRPYDYALGQKDFVFVKENGLFRKSHGWSK